MAPLARPLASANSIEATRLVRTSGGPRATGAVKDQTVMGGRRMGLETACLGVVLSGRRWLSIVARTGTNSIADAGLSVRLQGSLPSRLTTMVVVEMVGLSVRRAEGRIEETPSKRLSEGRKDEGQMAWKTSSPAVPIFAIYRPSRPDALPRRLAQRIATVAGPSNETKAEALPLPRRLIQRNAAVAGRK